MARYCVLKRFGLCVLLALLLILGITDSGASLPRRADARAVEPLIAALKDNEEYVHRRAAEVLELIRKTQAG